MPPLRCSFPVSASARYLCDGRIELCLVLSPNLAKRRRNWSRLMALGLRKLLSWPIAAAVLFLLIPPALFYLYPTSFWVNTDYQPHGLADALNLAYRIADRQLYPARGMADHPGVPFYFMSWLALALAGYPIASKSPGFYTAVLEHVDAFFQITIWLAAL